MGCKKHVPLILIALVLAVLAFSGTRIPQAFAAVQKSFVLDLDSANFTFEESLFNDSSSSKEYDFPSPSGGNVTYWIRMPKNSTVLNATMSLTGKIIYVYSVQASSGSIKGLSIGNALGNDNQISLATTETDGKAKLLYGNNGSYIWNSTVSSGWDTYSTSIGNVTSDQGSEIAVGSQDGNVYLLYSNGTKIWQKSTGGQVQSVKIGDVYGSGINYIVAGLGSSVQVLNYSGGVNWSASVGCAVYDIAIGNFSSDLGNEIIVGCDSGKILILNSSGMQAANMTIGSDNINSADIGNVTSDAGNEIVAGSNDNRIYVINASGSIVWNYSTGGSVFSVKIGDVTNESQYSGNEVVAGSNDRKIYTLDSSGSLIWSFEADSYIKTIAIGNLTSGTGDEVAAGAGNGYIYIFNFDYFPTNVSIDANGSAYDWIYLNSEKLRTAALAGGTPAFINSIQTSLNNCTADSSGACNVSLLFHSDGPGKLNISSLNVTYSYNISSLVSSPLLNSTWSRTRNINVNESVGNQVRNISFTAYPFQSILVQYIKVNQSASACDFNGTSYSTSTVEGQKVCDISASAFTIAASGSRPGPFLLWDNTMGTGTPVLMNESQGYYTYATDNFVWRKNLTIWITTSTIIYNVTANVSLDEAAVHGVEFLNATWGGLTCDITPEAGTSTCNQASPVYIAKNCFGEMFYVCKQDTNANGVYDFFKWVQPYATIPVYYKAGGSTNLIPNLSSQNVTPSQAVWGSWFNYSDYVNDSESDSVNVTLWVMRNLSGTWQRISEQNISGPGEIWFNLTSDSSWAGLASYKFQYQDFNSSGYAIHTSQNSSVFSGPTVLKHNVSMELIQGNNSIANRSESVLFAVRINDTDNGSWSGMSGTRCAFWVTTDGANFGQAMLNTSNTSGYCEYVFAPDGNYSAGNQTWKAGVWNDTYHSDGNSSGFTLTVKGRISIVIVSPSTNQTLYRNSTNSLIAGMVDEYGSPVNVSGYNCSFWFVNESGANLLGTNTTDSLSLCAFSWNPSCLSSLGQYSINVTLQGNQSGFHSIEVSEDSAQILMKDTLNTHITAPGQLSSYHKGDSASLNSTANDTCLLCSQSDFQSVWSLKWKQEMIIGLNESRGFSRANETIIINGSELEGMGIDLSDWRIAYTKVTLNGQEVPSEIKAWTNSSRTEINSTQVFLNSYSELVFLSGISALQDLTYKVYYNETNPADWNISFLRNGGFEAGTLSSWQCANGSGCDPSNPCDCGITGGNGETAGNYSLRLLANNNGNPSVTSAAYQSLGMQISSSYIKVRYKTAGFTPSLQLSAGTGSCTLNSSSSWTEALCQNSSFPTASSVNLTLSDSETGQNCYAYIDYICVAGASGDCISMDSGFSPSKTVYSQTALGSGNSSWQIQANETLGSRRILANSSGPSHVQNFSTVNIFLFGWSNLSWMNLSSGYCIQNQTYECMSNATIDFFCLALDANTSQGIYGYNVSFFLNGSLLGYNMTNSSGLSVFRWLNSTDQVGTYNMSCNISDSMYEPNTYYNITSGSSAYLVLEIISGSTNASIYLSPAMESAVNMTRESNHTFYLNVTINNTGNGSMYSPSINISSPAGVFVQPMSCPTITGNSSCSSSLQANVTQASQAGNLTINVTAFWFNADSTQGNSTNSTAVSVENNTVLNITETQVNTTIAKGDSRTAANFTVEAYGNTPLTNVTFSLSGANSSAISTWFSYSPASISSVSKAGTQAVLINLAVPSNQTEGIYTATITANSTGSSCSPDSECTDLLFLMINVTPPDWTLSPANLSKTIGLNGENGSVGTLTVTNSKGQNYSFSVTMTGNGSGYIKTDKTSFNLSAFSSTYVYVYHNTTGAYNPGYWFANVSIANLNGAFPANSNASVNLNVINLTLLIASPNETIPSLPVNASQRINITVNATLSGVPVTSDMAWTVSVGGQACGDVQSCFNCSGTSFWEINCTAPTIAGNIIYNDLAVTGNYTSMEGTIVSDTEASAIRYDDITPPQPHSVTVTPANYYSNISYIIINATITDNTLVNSSWLVITQPNGTDVTLFGTNLSSVYTFNFSSPNLLGDYDVYVYANDSQGYANSTTGWFDVYRPFQMSGTLANPNSANLSANFTLYRNGSSTVIHQFSTNASQGWYNLSGHDRIYDVLIASFGHVARLYSVNTTASAISQHGSQAFNLTGAFRLDDFPNRTSQDISNFDLPNTAQNIILGFVIETPNLSYSSAAITLDYTSALAAALQTITVTEGNLRILRCTDWNFQSRVCSAGEFSHFNESLTPNTTSNTFTFTATPSTAYAVAESCYPNICGQSQQQLPSGGTGTTGGTPGTTQPVCGNKRCETGENSQNCLADCPAEAEPFTVRTGITNIRLRPGDKATYPFYVTNLLNKNIKAEISVAGLENYFTFEKSSLEISPNTTAVTNVYVTVPETAEPGTYIGTITVSAEGRSKDIPSTMVISLEGRSQLNIIVKILAKRVEPGNDLKYTVTLTNIGFGDNLTVNMIYTVRNAQTEETVKQENEILNLSLATGDSHIMNKVMGIKEDDPPVGQYYLEVTAEFGQRSVSDTETFEVTQVFWVTPLGQFATWFAIVGAIITIAYYERRKYTKWKMKKSRYIFPVNYSKIPQQTDEAFWIGKIAETEKKAWFNPNDLSTHVLIAGSTGSGKSVGASIFIEEALEKKIPVIVFDPTAQWTGFVKQCEDENLLKYYRQFGMDERYAKPYKGMIFEITDPHVSIDFKKYMIPGEITVFTMNKLGPGEYDVAVKNIINAIFRTGWEESTKLKMLMVFDEVHRLLEKYGGIGGYLSLEQACREFRKWGIGILMCSQVLADFKEAIAGNVLTDIQLNTKSLIDIRKVETKYGSEYATRISRQGVGVGMLQNPKYNEGKPYFVQFRPTWHNPHKITDEEMEFYKEFAQRLEVIEQKIESMKKSKRDTSDLEIELKLAKDKLKQGRFRMAKIYITSLEEHLNIKQER